MATVSKNQKRLFWLDLEMSGLDEKIHHILEIAIIVTDMDLNSLEEYHRIVFQPPDVLKNMDDWCTKTHGESGLTAAIPNGKPIDEVDQDVVALIDRHYSKRDRVVLVGNSINNDKRFIDKYMPKTADRLHYRLIDVSSFKEIFREKYGVRVAKANSHRAIQDIQESINELKTYLSYVHVQ